MLRYVTLRYVTLRYVTLRYVTLCYAMLRYVMLRYVMLCYVMLHIPFLLVVNGHWSHCLVLNIQLVISVIIIIMVNVHWRCSFFTMVNEGQGSVVTMVKISGDKGHNDHNVQELMVTIVGGKLLQYCQNG